MATWKHLSRENFRSILRFVLAQTRRRHWLHLLLPNLPGTSWSNWKIYSPPLTGAFAEFRWTLLQVYKSPSRQKRLFPLFLNLHSWNERDCSMPCDCCLQKANWNVHWLNEQSSALLLIPRQLTSQLGLQRYFEWRSFAVLAMRWVHFGKEGRYFVKQICFWSFLTCAIDWFWESPSKHHRLCFPRPSVRTTREVNTNFYFFAEILNIQVILPASITRRSTFCCHLYIQPFAEC